MKKIILSIFSIVFCSTAIVAQNDRNETLINAEKNGWEYEIRAGINIGGASPLPLPVEIRSINSYKPRFNGSLEGTVTRWLGDKKIWGVSTGIRLEVKGMHTGATVKNYSTEIVDIDSKVSGYWTGYVNTKYSSSFLTVPVMANYRLDKRWKLRAGMFVSYRLDGDFSGYVTNGYLREGTPVGEKVEFKDGKQGTYDFSDNLRKLHTGAQIGASWQAFNHFNLNADLTWGINNIFKSSFKTVTFNMYPIYLNVGFGYKF